MTTLRTPTVPTYAHNPTHNVDELRKCSTDDFIYPKLKRTVCIPWDMLPFHLIESEVYIESHLIFDKKGLHRGQEELF